MKIDESKSQMKILIRDLNFDEARREFKNLRKINQFQKMEQLNEGSNNMWELPVENLRMPVEENIVGKAETLISTMLNFS